MPAQPLTSQRVQRRREPSRRTSDEFQSPRNDFEHVAHFQAARCDVPRGRVKKQREHEREETRKRERERERERKRVVEASESPFVRVKIRFICVTVRSARSLAAVMHAASCDAVKSDSGFISCFEF